MWFCFNDSLVSTVADKNDSTRLMVRARRKADLEHLFGADAEIVETAHADYRWRTFVSREAFTALVADRINAISYTNFKDSVEDSDRHDLYLQMWSSHLHYQQTDPATRSKKDRSRHLAWGPGDIEIIKRSE